MARGTKQIRMGRVMQYKRKLDDAIAVAEDIYSDFLTRGMQPNDLKKLEGQIEGMRSALKYLHVYFPELDQSIG